MLGLFCLPVLSAQDMPRTVVGSAGDYYQNLLFGNLHWTVGEIAVSNYQNGLELGEGFHQVYYDLLVEVDDPLPAGWEISVYPNPTTDWINLRFPELVKLDANLYTLSGQLLFELNDLSGTATVDLGIYPEGTYLLQLRDEDGRQRTVRVLKMRK